MTDASGNIARAREFVRKVQEEGRLDLIDDFLHPDFSNGTAEGDLPKDRTGVRIIMAALCDAFAERTIEIVHCSEADDVVASHKVLHGRHVGDWLGRPPSGERVCLRHMDFLRFEDGKIIEHWSALRPLQREDA